MSYSSQILVEINFSKYLKIFVSKLRLGDTVETDCFVFSSPAEVTLLFLLTVRTQGTFPGLERNRRLVYSVFAHHQLECMLKENKKQKPKTCL